MELTVEFVSIRHRHVLDSNKDNEACLCNRTTKYAFTLYAKQPIEEAVCCDTTAVIRHIEPRIQFMWDHMGN